MRLPRNDEVRFEGLLRRWGWLVMTGEEEEGTLLVIASGGTERGNLWVGSEGLLRR